MGLMDVLNGMLNGPRGRRDPNNKGGGMSPITMAILALLAYKAYQKIGGGEPTAAPDQGPARLPGRDTIDASLPGGGLGDLLKGGLGDLLGGGASPGRTPGSNTANAGPAGGLDDLLKGLGGLLGGSAAGTVLSGGLDDLLKQFQQHGQGDKAQSWISKGPNKRITPAELEQALGEERIKWIVQQTGIPKAELLEGLSRELPDAVDKLTPEGRVPDAREAARAL